MKRNYKFLGLLLVLLLSSCETGSSSDINSSAVESESITTSVENSSNAESSVSEDISSELISETLSSSEDAISSEDEVSSELASSVEVSSEEPSSSAEVSSETPSSSERPGGNENGWVDEGFYSAYAYNDLSYDIALHIPFENPYAHITNNEARAAFYANGYTRATSYEDAMYRTMQGLVSGDIRDTPLNEDYPLNHLPNRAYKELSTYRTNEGTYEYDDFGNFKAYTINTLHGKTKKIYYGAAYVSLDDVAAYLFAFGRGPANQATAKNSAAQRTVIANWGVYGRVNDAYYSSDVTRYLYEAKLPYTDNGGVTYYDDMYDYHELDFGYTYTPWGYGIASDEPYNNGSKITRGTVRLVYTAKKQSTGEWGAEFIPVEHRHVFLTINHYNDFIEYLNYEGGWGVPFGWMSAGNDYVAGMSASQYGPGYYDFIDPIPQTDHPLPELKTLNELRSLIN